MSQRDATFTIREEVCAKLHKHEKQFLDHSNSPQIRSPPPNIHTPLIYFVITSYPIIISCHTRGDPAWGKMPRESSWPRRASRSLRAKTPWPGGRRQRKTAATCKSLRWCTGKSWPLVGPELNASAYGTCANMCVGVCV